MDSVHGAVDRTDVHGPWSMAHQGWLEQGSSFSVLAMAKAWGSIPIGEKRGGRPRLGGFDSLGS